MAVIVATDDDLLDLLSTNDKVIVKYQADWCGSCKLISPKFKRMSDADEYQGILFLEIDSEANPISRAHANVDNLPFFATFSNGQLVEGKASAKEESINAMLQALSS